MLCQEFRWREALEGLLFGHRSPYELMIARDQTIGLAQRSCYEDEDIFARNLAPASLENFHQLWKLHKFYHIRHKSESQKSFNATL
jgi:hypothetical protein